MTVCVGTLADDSKTLVFAADKAIGIGMIQAELAEEKILPLGEKWRVLISGNDIAPVFPIMDRARAKLGASASTSLAAAVDAMHGAYIETRLASAEVKYLAPREHYSPRG